MLTEYDVDRDLSQVELQELLDYTRGQWSDGRGEFCLDDFSVSGFRIDTCIPPSRCSVEQTTGEAHKPTSDKTRKTLTAKWKKAAERNKPKGQSKALIDCLKALDADQWEKAEQLLPKVNMSEISRCSGKFSYLDGWNMLSYLVFKNRPEMVRRAIELGADVNFATDSQQRAPIHWLRSVEILDILVSAGVDLKKVCTFKKTALHHACSHVSVELVERLLNLGLEVDAKDMFNTTPLMLAAKHGKLDTVKLLLERGADPNARDGSYSVLSYAITVAPMYGLASYEQQEPIIKLLEAAGAQRWSAHG